MFINNGQLAIARWSLPVVGGQSSIDNHQRGTNNRQRTHCVKRGAETTIVYFQNEGAIMIVAIAKGGTG
nr:hypothetical protein SHINE37_80010 [Rhizobiaceae bacterium]